MSRVAKQLMSNSYQMTKLDLYSLLYDQKLNSKTPHEKLQALEDNIKCISDPIIKTIPYLPPPAFLSSANGRYIEQNNESSSKQCVLSNKMQASLLKIRYYSPQPQSNKKQFEQKLDRSASKIIRYSSNVQRQSSQDMQLETPHFVEPAQDQRNRTTSVFLRGENSQENPLSPISSQSAHSLVQESTQINAEQNIFKKVRGRLQQAVKQITVAQRLFTPNSATTATENSRLSPTETSTANPLNTSTARRRSSLRLSVITPPIDSKQTSQSKTFYSSGQDFSLTPIQKQSVSESQNSSDMFSEFLQTQQRRQNNILKQKSQESKRRRHAIIDLRQVDQSFKILQIGTLVDFCYFVYEGELEIITSAKNGKRSVLQNRRLHCLKNLTVSSRTRDEVRAVQDTIFFYLSAQQLRSIGLAYGQKTLGQSISNLILDPFFGQFSQSFNEQLLKRFQPRIFFKGQVVYSQGDKIEGVYLLLRGRIRRSQTHLSHHQNKWPLKARKNKFSNYWDYRYAYKAIKVESLCSGVNLFGESEIVQWIEKRAALPAYQQEEQEVEVLHFTRNESVVADDTLLVLYIQTKYFIEIFSEEQALKFLINRFNLLQKQTEGVNGVQSTQQEEESYNSRKRRLLDEAIRKTPTLLTIAIEMGAKISETIKRLQEEYQRAQKIADANVKIQTIEAIALALQKLQQYQKTPSKGLVIFAGKVQGSGSAEKTATKIAIDIQPTVPLTKSIFVFEKAFILDPLRSLLADEKPFGFIVVDAEGALFAKLHGNCRETVSSIVFEIPKKSCSGDDKQLFNKLRSEKKQQAALRIAEVATQSFIASDKKPAVQAIVLAGVGEFKNELRNTQLLGSKLSPLIKGVVDVSYGGENGLNEAIENSKQLLSTLKFVKDKELLSTFYANMARDNDTVVYGARNTIKLLENGVVKTLLLSEGLALHKLFFKRANGGKKYNYFNTIEIFWDIANDGAHQKQLIEKYQDAEFLKKVNLFEWILDSFQEFGAELELIGCESTEGIQFLKGFQGIGALLHYKVGIQEQLLQDEQENEEDKEWRFVDNDYV